MMVAVVESGGSYASDLAGRRMGPMNRLLIEDVFVDKKSYKKIRKYGLGISPATM